MQFFDINPNGTPRKAQQPNEIVVLDEQWEKTEIAYGIGARAKTKFSAPHTVPYDFLIPYHGYVLKYFEEGKQRWHFWSEIIASIIGRHIGIAVPPVFMAYWPEKDVYGCISEWVYNYPFNRQSEINMAGRIYFQRIIKNFDVFKGKQHNIVDIERLPKEFGVNDLDCHKQWIQSWSDLLLFDALIGNSDRHQENWEFLIKPADNGSGLITTLAAFFDNGSSLGYNIREDSHFPKSQEKFWNGSKSHINLTRDCTQYRNDGKGKQLNLKTTHEDILRYYIKTYPECRSRMLQVLSFNISYIQDELMLLLKFKINLTLTIKRVNFIIDLLEYRKKKITEIVNAY